MKKFPMTISTDADIRIIKSILNIPTFGVIENSRKQQNTAVNYQCFGVCHCYFSTTERG